MKLRFYAVSLALLFVVGGGKVSWGQKENSADEKVPSQLELNDEAGAEFAQSDKALNTAYGELMTTIEKCGPDFTTWKEKLRAAQRDWIKFRDSNCDYESAPLEGGQAWSMEYNGCRSSMTNERTRRLREMLDQFKDVNSCP